MLNADFGTIEQFVGFGDSLDRLCAKVLSLESDHVDTSWPSWKTLCEHIRWNVLQDAAKTTHKTVTTDRSEMVNGNAATERGVVLNMNMAAEHHGICHDDPIFDFAIVCNVRAGHQVALISNKCDSILFFGSSVYCHRFAKDITVADDDLRWGTLVAEILWFAADDAAGKEMIFATNAGVAGDRNVIFETGPASDFGVGANDTKRTDSHFIVELSARVDHGGMGDNGGHEFLFRT